jgi:hypothetical protein
MEKVQDEFEGFGEGFGGFPKRLPDDSVEYSLFVIDAKIKSNKEHLARLEAIRKEALRLTGDLLKDYIWQRDAFKLDIESKDGMPVAWNNDNLVTKWQVTCTSMVLQATETQWRMSGSLFTFFES